MSYEDSWLCKLSIRAVTTEQTPCSKTKTQRSSNNQQQETDFGGEFEML